MKLKNIILTLCSILLLACPGKVIAQSDSTGKKFYAYAHLYSDDTYTEYISSVFCWFNNPPKNSKNYPKDYLTAKAKLIFKDNLPDIPIRRCVCRFEIDSSNYYTAEQAYKAWNSEISDSKSQNITVGVISFPDYIGK